MIAPYPIDEPGALLFLCFFGGLLLLGQLLGPKQPKQPTKKGNGK